MNDDELPPPKPSRKGQKHRKHRGRDFSPTLGIYMVPQEPEDPLKTPIKNVKRFTSKELLFLNEFRKCLLEEEAWKAAGLKRRPNLKKPALAVEIEKIRAMHNAAANLTADAVMQEVQKVAFHDPAVMDMLRDEEGNWLPLSQIPEELRKSLKIEDTYEKCPDGPGFILKRRVTPWDKPQALVTYAKMRGIIKPEGPMVNVNVGVGVNMSPEAARLERLRQIVSRERNEHNATALCGPATPIVIEHAPRLRVPTDGGRGTQDAPAEPGGVEGVLPGAGGMAPLPEKPAEGSLPE